jgi:hypothetical protein
MLTRADRARPASAPLARPPWSGGRHVIPFDHAATFALRGQPGRVVQDVINIGPDGVFVATAIGYGFEEERARELPLVPSSEQSSAGRWLPGDVTLGQIPLDALIDGVRLAPRYERLAITPDAGATPELLDEPLALPQIGLAFQRMTRVGGGKADDDLSFLFTLADSASGRELQDAPAHNIASLGLANGERPFRPLAQPVQFLPRSTVRVQVEERSFDRSGTLFIVLYGYKVLTSSVCPEPTQRAVQVLVTPPLIGEAIPFDYVASVELSGRAGNRLEAEIPVSAEGDFIATAIGYGLAGEERTVAIDWAALDEISDTTLAWRIATDTAALNTFDTRNTAPSAWPATVRFALADLPLRCLGARTLREGFRLRPDYVNLALDSNSGLSVLSLAQIARMFESINRTEDVSFRYTLTDTGVGAELQNQALNNVAGLGIANGDRPFKRFSLPMQLLPRSTLRIGVEEVFGRGTLFFAFHGFKRLVRA